MCHWRIPLKVSSLLIGLGLLGLFFSLTLTVNTISDARESASAFDQAESLDPSSQGFVPIMAPPAEIVGPVAPPRLLSPTTGQALITSSPSIGPTFQPVSGQAPAAGDPSPTATARPLWIPDRLVIPSIQLEARVSPAQLKTVDIRGTLYPQWAAPDSFLVGWHGTSAPLGVPGNTVLNGHHNVHGEVFGHLVDLQVGDLILVYSGDRPFAYVIALKMILPERFKPLAVRQANAQWIQPSPDERLTLITCWPYESNTHRLIIVATPVSLDEIANAGVTPRLTPRPLLDWKPAPSLTVPPPDVTDEAPST